MLAANIVGPTNARTNARFPSFRCRSTVAVSPFCRCKIPLFCKNYVRKFRSVTLRSHRRRSSVFIGVYREAVSSPMNTEFELIFPSRRVRSTSRQFCRINAGSKIASFKIPVQILIFPSSSLFIGVIIGEQNAGQEGDFGHR